MSEPIDPHVVAAWTAAWALFRGLEPPRPSHGGWYVRVDRPEQKARYVFAALDAAALRALAESISEPWVFLKVCAPAERVAAALPAHWTLHDRLMLTAPLARLARAAPAPRGYAVRLAEGEFVTARVEDPEGEAVASGNLWCSGGLAFIDRVATDEPHRRRGLARALMAALTAEALARGAHQGVLVATAMGEALYRSLGWSPYTPYTSAVRRA